jgi:diguanylate cyclase (GGDEF)-like protein
MPRASQRNSRGGLLGRFALLTLVVLTVLGVVFAMLLNRTIQRGELQQAAQVAAVLSDATIGDVLAGDDVRNGLSKASIAEINMRMARAQGRASIVAAGVIRADGVVVYSTDPTQIGKRARPSTGFRIALTGVPYGTFIEDPAAAGKQAHGKSSTLVQADVPFLMRGTTSPVAVVEICLPSEIVSSRIATQQRWMYAILTLGLIVLFSLLLAILWVAARRLRRDADHHEFMASHDSLTGLPNRVHLATATEQLFGDEDSPSGGVLMLLDLDGFKDVNDSLGHSAGDDLLVDVAERLAEFAPTGSTIARLGGDEFAVVLPGAIPVQRARAAARRLLVAFDRPFQVRDISVSIDASVGIAIAGLHGDTRDELLQRADIAMYAAKRGKRRITVYSDDLDPMGADVLAVVADLRRALDAGELRLHYQPKVNMQSRSVSSVEALVRWRHPVRGLLMPAAFIPFAERSGLIGKVTLWVIDEAVRQCREWADQGHFLTVAINISQSSLLDPAIGSALVAAIEAYDVPASAIEVEITESALTADLDGAAEALAALHAHGVRISIDDYGTGYSSIAHLRALPVQCIKIDRSYVAGMLEDPASTSIVRSTLDLAHELGLEVVAEGVETQVEYEALLAIGCDVAQGYYCARPMPGQSIVEWMTQLTAPKVAVAPTHALPDFSWDWSASE